MGRGGKVEEVYFTNEDTLAFTYACTNRDGKSLEMNRILSMHLNMHADELC